MLADDEQHHAAVLGSAQVQQVLSRHGLMRADTWAKGRLHNGGMKAYKDAWTIPLPARGIDGINVHFEARRPGELQVDVEVFPYEGGIGKDAERLAELRPHIAAKADLIEAIRAGLANDAICVRELGVTTKGLRDPAVPSTLCAVKFLNDHGERGTAEADATFVARVIDHVTPLLDQVVREAAPRLGTDGQRP